MRCAPQQISAKCGCHARWRCGCEGSCGELRWPVDPDLVPKVEAVGNGLRRAMALHWHAFQLMHLASFGEVPSGESDDAEANGVKLRRPVAGGESEPDCKWKLCSEFVKNQREQQADRGVRGLRSVTGASARRYKPGPERTNLRRVEGGVEGTLEGCPLPPHPADAARPVVPPSW